MELDHLLEKIASEEDINDYTITKSAGSEKGDGYSGDITCVVISGKDANRKNTKILNLIMKKAASSVALRNQIPIASIYKREIYMYEAIFDIFRELETEKGLPASYFSPIFYGSNVTDTGELLLLENLKTSGYRLFERRIPMDENHVSLVLTEYGRLHALSLALRYQKPKEFEDSLESIDEVFIKCMIETGFTNTIIERCSQIKHLLDSHVDAKMLTAYDNFVKSIDSFFKNLPETVDKYSVALHGDCWINNMMFKYMDNDANVPDQVRFIDFQGSRLGSPVLDVAYFLYACSSKTIIDNANYYKQLYYKSLSSYLKKLGNDPEDVFPYSVFEDHWKKYAKYGLLFAVICIRVMLSEKDETVDLSELSESGADFSTAFNYDIAKADEYNDRVRHILLHFLHNNLF